MWLLEEMESITELGDLHAMDFAKNANDVRKLHQEIKKKEWDVSLVDSSQGIDTGERDFGKLYMFYSHIIANPKAWQKPKPKPGRFVFLFVLHEFSQNRLL